MNNKKNFFEPRIGQHYSEGINGKKVLVVGASIYCSKTGCPLYKQCTDPEKKDSSAFDTLCPEYKQSGSVLHDEPSNVWEDTDSRTLKNFTTSLQPYLVEVPADQVCEYFAFTEYIQYIVGAPDGVTKPQHISQRDFDAFVETVKVLQPDVIIIWGCVINKPLVQGNPYVIDKAALPDTQHYVSHMSLPGVDHTITLLNCYHPSSSGWHSDFDIFAKYLKQVIRDFV